MLDICHPLRYNSEAVSRNAAIAQSVERILGKDEVASSNLASSSKTLILFENWGFSFSQVKNHDLIPN